MNERNQPVVVRGETPPFADLVNFAPLEVPTERKSPGLVERWTRLAARTQAAIVGCCLVVVAGGAVMLQPRPTTQIVDGTRDGRFIPPPPPERKEVPPIPFPEYVVAIKPIPVNTQITGENLKHYFGSIEAKNHLPGSVMIASSLKGQYAQRSINNGQFIMVDDFGRDAFKPNSPDEFHTITEITTRGLIYYRYERRGGHWKLVDTERETRYVEDPAALQRRGISGSYVSNSRY